MDAGDDRDGAASEGPRAPSGRQAGATDRLGGFHRAITELLGRNGIPFGFYPADQDRGRGLLAEAGAIWAPLPVVIVRDGRVLEAPSNTEVAEALGVRTRPGDGLYDVAVIGAGPAGLAAAVYGASEGLSIVILEPEAIGGQAGTSSLIRNYLGFPAG